MSSHIFFFLLLWWQALANCPSPTPSYSVTGASLQLSYAFSPAVIDPRDPTGRTLALLRGCSYDFQVTYSDPPHPWIITTNSTWAADGSIGYAPGATNNHGCASPCTVHYDVPSDAPSPGIYYQCTQHNTLLGAINIYSHVCPPQQAGCLGSNRCTRCDPACGEYCQNTVSDNCGPSNCITCPTGYSRNLEGIDGSACGVNWQQMGATLSAPLSRVLALSRDGNFLAFGLQIFRRAQSNWTLQFIAGDPSDVTMDGVSALSDLGEILAYGDQMYNQRQGRVLVFGRSDSIWQKQGELVGTDGAQQGVSIALSGNGHVLAEGSYFDNNSRGAVWVFIRNENSWFQQGPKLVGTGGGGGGSVALSTTGTILASGGVNGNGVWIFVQNGNTWIQEARLEGSDGPNAGQGASVSLSSAGDILAVGGASDPAPDSGARRGAVWMFLRIGTTWSQIGSKLVGWGFSGYSAQGCSVSLSRTGEVLAVGGCGDGATGAVWTFVRNCSSWSQRGEKLLPPAPPNGTNWDDTGYVQFGGSVSISGDGQSLAVSAYYKALVWSTPAENSTQTPLTCLTPSPTTPTPTTPTPIPTPSPTPELTGSPSPTPSNAVPVTLVISPSTLVVPVGFDSSIFIYLITNPYYLRNLSPFFRFEVFLNYGDYRERLILSPTVNGGVTSVVLRNNFPVGSVVLLKVIFLGTPQFSGAVTTGWLIVNTACPANTYAASSGECISCSFQATSPPLSFTPTACVCNRGFIGAGALCVEDEGEHSDDRLQVKLQFLTSSWISTDWQPIVIDDLARSLNLNPIQISILNVSLQSSGNALVTCEFHMNNTYTNMTDLITKVQEQVADPHSDLHNGTLTNHVDSLYFEGVVIYGTTSSNTARIPWWVIFCSVCSCLAGVLGLYFDQRHRPQAHHHRRLTFLRFLTYCLVFSFCLTLRNGNTWIYLGISVLLGWLVGNLLFAFRVLKWLNNHVFTKPRKLVYTLLLSMFNIQHALSISARHSTHPMLSDQVTPGVRRLELFTLYSLVCYILPFLFAQFWIYPLNGVGVAALSVAASDVLFTLILLKKGLSSSFTPQEDDVASSPPPPPPPENPHLGFECEFDEPSIRYDQFHEPGSARSNKEKLSMELEGHNMRSEGEGENQIEGDGEDVVR